MNAYSMKGGEYHFWLRNISEALRTYILDRLFSPGADALAALSMLLMGSVLCFVLWQKTPVAPLLIWFSALLVLVVVSYLLRRAHAIRSTFHISILLGLLWVIAVWVFFPQTQGG